MKGLSLFPISLLLALLAFSACGPGGGRPRRLWEFKVEFGENEIPAQMAAGQKVTAVVVVKNTGKSVWPSKPDEKGRNAVNLSYHWLGRNGNVVVFDGLRTPLPHDVGAGESVRLIAWIQTPDRAGKYTLEVTLVQETVAWFPDKNGDKLTIPVVVVEEQPGDSPKSGKQVRSEINTSAYSKPSLLPDKTRARLPEKNMANLPNQRDKTRPANIDLDKVTVERGPGAQPWTVQAGAFPQRQEAEILAKNLRNRNHDAFVIAARVNGREWHRVRIGRLGSRMEAQKLQEILKTKEGLQSTLVTNSR